MILLSLDVKRVINDKLVMQRIFSRNENVHLQNFSAITDATAFCVDKRVMYQAKEEL